MYDDGDHGDGQEGDGVYGISIIAGPADIQYYIYAENSDAVTFLPANAEYEFYNITVDNGIVINEFLAINDATNSDEYGEFDDWIELYYNLPEPINLEGYTLTDELADSEKWTFPNIEIVGEGYLLVWADDDEEQGDLHTNFKLSGSGEEIGLFNPNGDMLGGLSFGVQSDDISYGRITDGGNEWQFFDVPTPGFTNTDDLNINHDKTIPDQYILFPNYPNPFNPLTTLRYDLPENAMVNITIYDMLGREIKTLVNATQDAGFKSVQWDATNDYGKPVSAGIYLYQIQAGEFVQTKKMVFLK
tara:strand:- start:12 stop:917 length:906 start_codon:yes stop_codon:yes gene_type:complete